MSEWILVGLAGASLAVSLWLLSSLKGLREAMPAAQQDLADRLVAAQAAQLRQLGAELAQGAQRRAERLASLQAEVAERLRGQIAELVRANGEALAALHRRFETVSAAQREEGAARLAELDSGITARQEALRSALTEQVLKTLAEQSRAERELLQEGLAAAARQQAQSVEALTRTTEEKLSTISGVVHERLDEGFRKTNETFANVMARLATIDEAQKKIDGLTSNVISLQELLGDKRSRGAFGEVQLEALVRNALPPDAYGFQVPLASGVRADCVLSLPEPTGRIAVDAKFPLENYQRMFDASEPERRAAQSAFRADVKRHVDAIASKYIVAGETADGAVMFVPAEAVFAEIHAYHPEVVQYAMARRVWIVSPTTLMAVLNTARAVLKDVETRRQIHVIKDALGRLAKDFARFDERMMKLASHIRQANDDVQEVQTSSRKITNHFAKIESVQLEDLPRALASDQE